MVLSPPSPAPKPDMSQSKPDNVRHVRLAHSPGQQHLVGFLRQMITPGLMAHHDISLKSKCGLLGWPRRHLRATSPRRLAIIHDLRGQPEASGLYAVQRFISHEVFLRLVPCQRSPHQGHLSACDPWRWNPQIFRLRLGPGCGLHACQCAN